MVFSSITFLFLFLPAVIVLAIHHFDGLYGQDSFAYVDYALGPLATALGRELNVPMRLANLALEELTEAVNRGWSERDSRVAMLLQEERAGVEIKVAPERLQEVLRQDG